MMKQVQLFAALAGLAIFAPVVAHADAPAWTLGMKDSSLDFTYIQEGTRHGGHFGSFDADIRFDPADPSTASISATIDLASVNAGSKDADDSLKSGDWFNVKLFPKATFTSTRVSKDGDGYRMEATLSIRDKAVPVTLPFKLTVTGDSAHASGSLVLDREAFGLGGGFWANPDFIAHEVTVSIDLVAHRAP
ncbi:MAG: YceI family protein [Alphaproteobacteria bacterium]|nr:MAG: YceI family protein [Alphaproteobacteria bacterium]